MISVKLLKKVASGDFKKRPQIFFSEIVNITIFLSTYIVKIKYIPQISRHFYVFPPRKKDGILNFQKKWKRTKRKRNLHPQNIFSFTKYIF